MDITPQSPEVRRFHAFWAAYVAGVKLRRRLVRLAQIILSLVALGSVVLVIPMATARPVVGWTFFGLCLLLMVVLERSIRARGR